MLTGVGYQAESLTVAQADPVAHLVVINKGTRTIGGQSVGDWMVKGDPAAVLSGSAPVDYLTQQGTAGLRPGLQSWTSFLGIYAEPAPGMGTEEFVRTVIRHHVRRELKGKLRRIHRRYRQTE